MTLYSKKCPVAASIEEINKKINKYGKMERWSEKNLQKLWVSELLAQWKDNKENHKIL